MARVFISYASEDLERAGLLHQWLLAAGHKVFLAKDLRDGIAGGEPWRLRLHEQLRWADAVVCVLTSSYVASIWCTAEVAIAQSRGSRLIPVVAEPGIVHPLLSDIQHIDLIRASADVPAALNEALRRVDAAGGFGWPDDRSPFPGLRPFEIDQHRVFFGRERETEELAELLRSSAEQAKAAVLLVVGPSGCGKSSLIQAGLLHVMAQEPRWRILAPIVPGADPVTALARELAAAARRSDLSWTMSHVQQQLVEHGLLALIDELLLASSGGPGRYLLIVVDQFEELLTQTSRGERARFAELLLPALSGPVQVMATLRLEFVDQLLVDTDLAVLPADTYMLRPLHREALHAVIQEPARLAGIEVDDDLVARLVADTGSGEALPLLAFTLARLADGLRRGGQLSAARYEQLGGVQGALTHQADLALTEASAATGRSGEEIIRGLLRLITVDEQGRPIRWRVDRDELKDQLIQELDVFIQRRLVTTDTENGNAVVEVAHEAFLSAWPPLAQAIKDNASALRASRAIEQAATEWNKNHRSPTRLWERGQLAAAQADLGTRFRARHMVTDHAELSPTAQVFLRASIRRDRRRRRRALTVLSVLLVFSLAASVLAVTQWRAAEQQRDLAVSRQAAAQALQLRATNPALAAQLSLAAYQLVPTSEARSSLLSIAADPYAARLTGHKTGLTMVAFSRDGHTLASASADTTVRLWDISDLRHPHLLSTLTGHTKEVWSVAFSPDGHTLASASLDRTVRLWDISDLRHPHLLSTLTGHTKEVWSVAFSPDGHTLASASLDRTVRLWDISDLRYPHPLGTVTGHSDAVRAVAFSPDGHTLASTSDDTTMRLWDVSDVHQPRPLSTLHGHTNAVWSVAFSPDGHTLASASDDTTARLWDISDVRQPQPLSTLTGHTARVLSVGFSSDGRILATASLDTTARLWDISDVHQPQALRTLTGHTSFVWSVVFSPDGHTLATASADNTARLWDLPGPIMVGHTATIRALAFSPDGHTLASASSDHTARLWDVLDFYHPHLLGILTGHTNTIWSVAFSPDGHTLATASDDHTARLWDVLDFYHPHLLGILTGHTNTIWSVAFSPDGHTLATASDDNTARLWDISDPRQPHPLSTLTFSNGVLSVVFSPDGRTLATGSTDHIARLWDVHNPRQPHPLSTLTGHTNDVSSVAFSPDGRTLATASVDTTARLWDISDPRQPHPLSTLTGHTNAIWSVAFSPDGRTLATASVDNTARLWDISDVRQPQPLSTLTGHTNTVRTVAFSPDGRTLATAGDDTTARLWETNVDDVASRICATTWPAITDSEWNQYLPDLPHRPPCP
jgi:WD40 repeat protein